ncbi:MULTISPECIES: type VII secretion target [Thermocrispum]|jgi:uncharacterized protein YukE|uniref:Type VII secretion target n=1 Tax=Thermocrispum agreste TaxID=37925 RepID=A0A2W4JPG5_9PSEU|nr:MULTISPECIES: type VII secretion target [Thermocrispum]PZM95687.1 MAG: hypothetical protein DIU77_11985 [Thermocrispum agreste]
MGSDINVNTPELRTYAKNLSYYTSEADKFGALIDQADVTNEAWGIIGSHFKHQYTDRLAELRDLLAEMKEGVETLADKITAAANVYDSNEEASVIQFGKHEATIDGTADDPKGEEGTR